MTGNISEYSSGSLQQALILLILAFLALLLPFAFPEPAIASVQSGQAKIVDAGTVEINGHRYILDGIMAPALSRRCVLVWDDSRTRRSWDCGRQAASALKSLIGSRRVACKVLAPARFSQSVARCYIRRGNRLVNLSSWLVRKGWASSAHRDSDSYRREEKLARASRVGLWRAPAPQLQLSRLQVRRNARGITMILAARSKPRSGQAA